MDGWTLLEYAVGLVIILVGAVNRLGEEVEAVMRLVDPVTIPGTVSRVMDDPALLICVFADDICVGVNVKPAMAAVREMDARDMTFVGLIMVVIPAVFFCKISYRVPDMEVVSKGAICR